MYKLLFTFLLTSLPQMFCVSQNDFSHIFDTPEKKEFAEQNPKLVQSLALVHRTDSKVTKFKWTYKNTTFYFTCPQEYNQSFYVSLEDYSYSKNARTKVLIQLFDKPEDKTRSIFEFCIKAAKLINSGKTTTDELLYTTPYPEIV